jgi:hypothetical protein
MRTNGGDTTFDLIIAKFGASLLLTGASMVGLLAPFWFFRLLPAGSTVKNQHHRDFEDNPGVGASDDVAVNMAPSGSSGTPQRQSPSAQEFRSPWGGASVVSVANCVSAGILLWTGLMHFFLESASSFSSPSLCPSHLVTSGGLACLEYGIGRAVLCLICGILIPLTIEKVVWPWVTVVVVGPQQHHQRQEGGVEPSIAALMVAHGQHSHGSSGHSHHHHHQALPVKAAHSSSSNSSMGSSGTAAPTITLPTASQLQQRNRQQAKDLASAVLIAILMSVHSATEGIAIGVEPSIASMRGSVSPLVVHKAFDGWLVGVSVYRTCDVVLRSAGGLVEILRYVLIRSPQKYALWIWLAALPFLLMSVAMVIPIGHQGNHDGAVTATDEGAAHSHMGATFPVAIAQATSSGSFLYVAVCAILLEELGDSSSAPTLAAVKKHAMLVVSCIAGLVLGSILSGEHE